MQQSTKFTVFLFSLLCMFSSGQVPAAKFYKWTDDDGNIHYSDKEPFGVESAEAVNISAPKTSESTHRVPAFTAENQDEQSPEEQKQKQQDDAQLKEYCNSLTSNIKTLEIGGRIKTIDADGNQKFLSDEEQQAKIKKYQSQYKDKCSP